MSATPNETAHRRLTLDAARATLAAEKAKRAASGRPTPPADPVHRWPIDELPGTRHIDQAKRERKRRTARARLAAAPPHVPPRLPLGPDRTCGNCGDPVDRATRGRCRPCDSHYRSTGSERSVTPRYGASKL